MLVRLSILFALFANPAYGHLPNFSEGRHGALQTAWPVEDVDLSIVLYHEVTCEQDILWMAFDAEPGQELFFQLGVPILESLESYRPSIALLAPGLPPLEDDVPFDVPPDLGGVVFHSDAVSEPMTFFEPITQTQSWIWVEERLNTPEAGSGYIVAWDPGKRSGKLWVAVGETEDFSNADLSEFAGWLEKTQRFHESGAFKESTFEYGVPCGADDSDDSGDSHGGCSVGPADAQSVPMTALLLVGLVWIGRRRVCA